MPLLPMQLIRESNSIEVMGLLDSGSTLNVLPFETGLSLGLDWGSQQVPVRLSGNLSDNDARAVVIHGTVADLPPTRLAFAWTSRTGIPVILGQMNFFLEFDIAFFRSRSLFTVSKDNCGNQLGFDIAQ